MVDIIGSEFSQIIIESDIRWENYSDKLESIILLQKNVFYFYQLSTDLMDWNLLNIEKSRREMESN